MVLLGDHAHRERTGPIMPSLFRFLAIVGVIAALVYGAMYALATYFDPQPRDITVSVPPDRFLKR